MLSALPQFVTEFDGTKFFARVSPCCYMYPGYPLQAEISVGDHEAESGARKMVHWKGKDATKCSEQDIRDAVDEYLREGGAAAVLEWAAGFPARAEAARAEFEQIMAEEQEQERQRDAQHKAEGFTHKVSAWIHPEGGGDDAQLTMYAKGKPEHDQIVATLKQHGSAVTNDYAVVEL
jgi:hypothetical protein